MAHHPNVPMSYPMAADQVREDLRKRFPKGTSTLELIKAGLRTATTRAASASPWKVGDTISFQDDPTVYRVTSKGLPEFNKDPEAWAKKEGWDPAAIRRDPKLLQQATKIGAVQTTFEPVDKADAPVKSVVNPTQTELNKYWALGAANPKKLSSDRPKIIKSMIRRLIKNGDVRPEAADMLGVLVVHAHDMILDRDRGESPRALRKVVDTQYLVGGIRAAEGKDEEEVAKSARTSERLGRTRGSNESTIDPELEDMVKKSLSGKSGQAYANKIQKQAMGRGEIPFAPEKRTDPVPSVSGDTSYATTDPMEERIAGETSRAAISRKKVQRRAPEKDTPPLQGPRQAPRVVAKYLQPDKTSEGKVFTAKDVGSKAFSKTRDEKGNLKPLVKRFDNTGRVQTARIDKAIAAFYRLGDVGSWEGSKLEDHLTMSQGKDKTKPIRNNNGDIYDYERLDYTVSDQVKAENATQYNREIGKRFGEYEGFKSDDPSKEPSFIFEGGPGEEPRPVLIKKGKNKGKQATYPNRSAERKQASKTREESKSLGETSDADVARIKREKRAEPLKITAEDKSPGRVIKEGPAKGKVPERVQPIKRVKASREDVEPPEFIDYVTSPTRDLKTPEKQSRFKQLVDEALANKNKYGKDKSKVRPIGANTLTAQEYKAVYAQVVQEFEDKNMRGMEQGPDPIVEVVKPGLKTLRTKSKEINLERTSKKRRKVSAKKEEARRVEAEDRARIEGVRADLDPRLLDEPVALPPAKAAERQPTHLRVLRLSDIAPRTRLSDEPPTPPTRIKVASDARGISGKESIQRDIANRRARAIRVQTREEWNRQNPGKGIKIRKGLRQRFKVGVR